MRRKIIPYNPKLKQLARNLRNNSTLSEVLLWRELKGKKLKGYDFHRQKPIDNYIVDFYCPELLLAIEIDGSTHNEKVREDGLRQRRLENLGVHVIRFADINVKKDLQGVLVTIEEWVDVHRPTPARTEQSVRPPDPLERRDRASRSRAGSGGPKPPPEEGTLRHGDV